METIILVLAIGTISALIISQCISAMLFGFRCGGDFGKFLEPRLRQALKEIDRQPR